MFKNYVQYSDRFIVSQSKRFSRKGSGYKKNGENKRCDDQGCPRTRIFEH